MDECYKGFAIEIRESIPGSTPETWAVRLRCAGWYYDLTCTYATRNLALECAKKRIDEWVTKNDQNCTL